MPSLMYIGPIPDLKNNKAKIQLFNEEMLKVQFETCPHHPWRCHGWHDFAASDFFGKFSIVSAYSPNMFFVCEGVERLTLVLTFEACLEVINTALRKEEKLCA